MQLLDDDMDELFRNAASQYPLKTDGSDWDAVMRRLPQSDNKQATAFNRLRDSKWLKWLLRPLLTLLVLIVCLPVLKVGVLPPKTGNGTAVVQNTNSNNVTPVTISMSTGSNSNTRVSNKEVPADVAKNNTASVPVNDRKSVAPVNDIKNSNASVTSVNGIKNNNASVTPVNDIKNSNASVTPVNGIKNNNAFVNVNNNSITLKANNTNPEIALAATEPFSLHLLASADQKELFIPVQLQTSSSIKLRKDTTVPPVKVKVPVQKGLYAGLVASPDFSTVKGQRVSNVGYNAGLIIGYRMSRHLAVETGLLYERKYYYSDASYFSTKKINPPANMKLINVDGWCKMFEIPLNVRYVFNIKQKSNWYVNAGISSYIMSKESYDYKYEMYGTVSTKNWAYNNATRNWFSIIHVGVGYEHRLGAVSMLRVEPYLKMPAGGVGIGSLPLTSVGLNIGITRPIRF